MKAVIPSQIEITAFFESTVLLKISTETIFFDILYQLSISRTKSIIPIHNHIVGNILYGLQCDYELHPKH